MSFNFSQMRFWFLDDNAAVWTNYQSYRHSLKWYLWNLRMNDGTDGVPGDNVSFADPAGYQGDNPGIATGRALKFLSGDYKNFSPSSNIVSPYHGDYILDSADPLILGTNPLWQYTWVAIQNLSSNPSLFRLELTSQDATQNNTGAWASYAKDRSYTRIKPLGLINGTYYLNNTDAGREDFLNRVTLADSATVVGMTTLPFLGTLFPHITYYGGSFPLTGGIYDIYWNACAENSLYTYSHDSRYGKIKYSYNNQSEYNIDGSHGFNNDGRYYPYQVCGWCNEVEGTRKTPSGGSAIADRDGMIVDNVPPGYTLFAIICRTRDVSTSQYGATAQSIQSASLRVWTYSEVRTKFSYVVEA